MEHHKTSKLSNDSTASKFVARKWIEVDDLLNGQYWVNKNLWFTTAMIRFTWHSSKTDNESWEWCK